MEINGYKLGRVIGSGSFGVTYFGYRIIDNFPVAIKTINLHKALIKGLTSDMIKREVSTFKLLAQSPCNKYVQCYHESFTGMLNRARTEFIISDYVNGTSLGEFIQLNSPYIQPRVLWKIYLQLIEGLKYIHDKGYAHRDIKPDNILIDADTNIKYIDFGFTCIQDIRLADATNFCSGIMGTKLYFPPEFLKTKLAPFNYKAQDVWSLTMVMYELAGGTHVLPFDIYDLKSLQNAPTRLPKYNLDDGRTNLFLQTICQNDPIIRPSIDSVLSSFNTIIMGAPWNPSPITSTIPIAPSSPKPINVNSSYQSTLIIPRSPSSPKPVNINSSYQSTLIIPRSPSTQQLTSIIPSVSFPSSSTQYFTFPSSSSSSTLFPSSTQYYGNQSSILLPSSTQYYGNQSSILFPSSTQYYGNQ